MLQLRAGRHGAPRDVLALVDTDEPPLRRDEIRVACNAVGLNFLDVMLCRGTYPAQPPPPTTPGVEVAGRIVEVGTDVPFRVGDAVVACPTLPHGALGERVVVDATLAVVAPDDVDPVQLAALPVNYQTAWFALRRAHLAKGETVLVHAGAGGVGIAATQLATAWGARVICTAGGPRKTRLCVEHGAAAAIDYTGEDFVARVLQLTDGRGADVVLDPVGGEVFGRSMQCLAFEGRIVPIGAAGGRPAPIDPLALTAANVSIIGLSWGSMYPYRRPDEVRAVYGELMTMLGHQVRPVIDRVVGLAAVADALADLEARRTVGKIIVQPERDTS